MSKFLLLTVLPREFRDVLEGCQSRFTDNDVSSVSVTEKFRCL